MITIDEEIYHYPYTLADEGGSVIHQTPYGVRCLSQTNPHDYKQIMWFLSKWDKDMFMLIYELGPSYAI